MFYEELYAELGRLFYSIAATDGKVHPSEKESLHQLIKSNWKPLEGSTDKYGTDQANLIDFAFEYEEAEGEGENGFQSFEAFYLENKSRFSPELCDSMGKSERINSTVFPSTYSKFIHIFIYLFIGTLSMALVQTAGIWEMPLSLIIATPFFLLEKSAKLMQDPFRNRPTDTAVTAIARTIEINIRQLLHEKDTPQPVQPGSFYLM